MNIEFRYYAGLGEMGLCDKLDPLGRNQQVEVR